MKDKKIVVCPFCKGYFYVDVNVNADFCNICGQFLDNVQELLKQNRTSKSQIKGYKLKPIESIEEKKPSTDLYDDYSKKAYSRKKKRKVNYNYEFEYDYPKSDRDTVEFEFNDINQKKENTTKSSRYSSGKNMDKKTYIDYQIEIDDSIFEEDSEELIDTLSQSVNKKKQPSKRKKTSSGYKRKPSSSRVSKKTSRKDYYEEDKKQSSYKQKSPIYNNEFQSNQPNNEEAWHWGCSIFIIILFIVSLMIGC